MATYRKIHDHRTILSTDTDDVHANYNNNNNNNSNNNNNNIITNDGDDNLVGTILVSSSSLSKDIENASNNNDMNDTTTSTTTAVITTNTITTTITLCLAMLTHSYLLISVFPYSGFLVIHLLQIPADQEDTAAKYAGLIASSFMIGRAVTSILWGSIIDRYGRKWALYTSLLLSAFFSILFGYTNHFRTAMMIRFALGCSNGMSAIIKTMVSDIHHNNVKMESRIMNIVMGMWGWGFLISPVISGTLAEPTKQYTNIDWLKEGTYYGTILRTYPFLLPNLLGAIFCIIATILAMLFVPETLPRYRQHSIVQDICSIFSKWCRYVPVVVPFKQQQYEMAPTSTTTDTDTKSSTIQQNHHHYQHTGIDHDNNKDHDDDGNFADMELSSSKEGDKGTGSTTSVYWMIISQRDIRESILLLWGYSFVGLAIDETFPLFCLSHTAGFGLEERDIGKILSFAGIIFATSQYFISHYSYVYCGGLYGSTKVGVALSAPTMFLIPLSLLINHPLQSSLKLSTFVFLGIVLAIHRCFSMLFFSNITVIMNRSVATVNRGAMNGVSGLGMSIAKALGPTFAGLLITFSESWLHGYASLLIFGIMGLFGVLIAWGAFIYLPQNSVVDNNHSMQVVDENTKSNNCNDEIDNEYDVSTGSFELKNTKHSKVLS